jgi:hypothetical protein
MHRLVLVLFACGLVSCQDGGINPDDRIIGPVVFEIEYINFAWGFTYQGKAIFEDGKLYSYNPGSEGIGVLHHADERYTAGELISKYEYRRTAVRTVSDDTLKYMAQLAAWVGVGDNTDTTMTGADMGAVTYSTYRYRADASKYERQILRVEGDWSFHNRSEAAIALVDLMRRL